MSPAKGKSVSESELKRMKSLIRNLSLVAGGPDCIRRMYGDHAWFESRSWRDADIGNADEWFLYFLTWGPWAGDTPKRIWRGVQAKYREAEKILGCMSHRQILRLQQAFPRPRHNFTRAVRRYLSRLDAYLRDENTTMKGFERGLRRVGWKAARAKLYKVCGVGDAGMAKVLDCYIRDRLRLQSFPIDSRVRDVLRDYRLPQNPNRIVLLARRLGWNPRVLARAVYECSDAIPAPSQR